ncbi:DMT family transporter [Saccharospirillum mangrovi]|uniref:DMT family transporter n=1 Tax=Saccharospirillum mangrovi TaxID=2161747 RepID=UPI000D3649D3|nr:DMT family transporter [Saccharospirillum mangrovi]
MTASTAPLVDHRQGVLVATLGVLVLSFDALLVRLVGASPYDIGFWRGALVFVSMTTFMVVTGRVQQFRVFAAHGVAALIITLLYGINTGLFVLSINHTSVANAVVVLASSSFFAALFSWLLLRETIPLRTWVAIVVAMAGVLIVFAGSLGMDQWLGDALALLLAMLMGLMLTLLRRLPNLPKMPVVALSGLVTSLLCVGFAEPLALSAASYGWLAVMGLLQMPTASVLIMTATRYLPAPEVSLFLLIETLLGPVWVWLVLSEAISPLTFFGGVAILGAIFVHSWLSLRKPETDLVAPTDPPL